MRHPPDTRDMEFAMRTLRRAQEQHERQLELSRDQL